MTNLSANVGAYNNDMLREKYKETWKAGFVHFVSAGNRDSLSEAPTPVEIFSQTKGVNPVTNLDFAGPPVQLHLAGQVGGSCYGEGTAFTAPGTKIFVPDRTGVSGVCPNSPAYCLAVPGSPGEDYAYLTGTSFASPMVAGVAALVLSANPNLDSVEIEHVLRATAEDLGDPGWDQYFGFGLPKADAAVELGVQMIFYDGFEFENASRWSGVAP